MIEPTRPKLNRFKYAAMLAGALTVAASPSVGFTAVATAESKTWDIENYDDCLAGSSQDQINNSINDQKLFTQGVLRIQRRNFHRRRLSRQMCGPTRLNRLRAHGSVRATFTFHPISPPHPQ